MSTYFAELKRTVDHHRSPLSEAALRDMSGASTFVKRAAEKEIPVRLDQATLYPVPAELGPLWEPLRESHYVYVPKPPAEDPHPWALPLRLVDAALHLERDPTERKITGGRATAEQLLREWIEDFAHEITDSRVRRELLQRTVASNLAGEDAQFIATAALAKAATGVRWVLWDPFRARTISENVTDDDTATRWFLRDEAGNVGLLVPYAGASPTWDPAYGAPEREAARTRRWQDLEETLRLERMSATDLKAHLGASGRTKKADLIREWFERPRWELLYPPVEPCV